jgi:hypothetical protein
LHLSDKRKLAQKKRRGERKKEGREKVLLTMVRIPHPDIPKIRGSESKFNIFWVKYGHSKRRPHSRR